MKKNRRSNPVALVPILVFLVLYLGTGIIFEYVMKIPMGFSHLLYYTFISYFCEYGIRLISYGSSSMTIITGFSWKKRTRSLTSWTNSKSNFSSVYNSFECSFFHSFISSLLFFIYFLPHRCPQWGHSYCFFS